MNLTTWLIAVQVLLSIITIIGLVLGVMEIMATLSEEFDEIKANLAEAAAELTAKIAALEEALAGGSLTTEQRAKLDEAKAAAKALADIVPNPPVEPPV